jgi:hypothetical protein
VLTLANMLDLFANKFARLRRRSLALPLSFTGAFNSFFFRHSKSCSFLVFKMVL